jgi:hypothetical protein
MDYQQIITWAGGLLIGSGVLWSGWKFLKPFLPANKGRDAVIERLIQGLNDRIVGPETKDAVSVPDRATALAYCEAVLRFLEKSGTKRGVDALIVVMSEIAAPTPKE